MSFKKVLDELKELKEIIMTIADNVNNLTAQVNANAQALAAIQTQLTQILALPAVTNNAGLTTQLNEVLSDLGDATTATTATAVAAAAAPATTITPTTPAVGS